MLERELKREKTMEASAREKRIKGIIQKQKNLLISNAKTPELSNKTYWTGT